MIVDIKVPSVGESVTEALLAQWFKKDGDAVKKDEPLFVIETDKVTLEVVSEADGVLSIKVPEGETVAIGTVVGTIDTESLPAAAEGPSAPEAPEAKEVELEAGASSLNTPQETAAAPAAVLQKGTCCYSSKARKLQLLKQYQARRSFRNRRKQDQEQLLKKCSPPKNLSPEN